MPIFAHCQNTVYRPTGRIVLGFLVGNCQNICSRMVPGAVYPALFSPVPGPQTAIETRLIMLLSETFSVFLYVILIFLCMLQEIFFPDKPNIYTY